MDVEVRLVLIVAAALAAPHAVVDRTLSCPVVQEGQAFVVSAQGSVTTPRNGAYLKFWPTPLTWEEPAVLPGLELTTQPTKILWDERDRCDVAPQIPLTRRGLRQDTVVTTRFVGSADALCRAAPHIRFRARIMLSSGTATHAQLVAAADNASKPLLYVDWTPRRIAYWLRPGCTT